MIKHSVTIEKIINGGFGIGRLPSGQVIFIPGVLPGESVIVTPQRGKKNYLFGKVLEISNSHSNRVVPPCPYYGSCGGCDLQHCDYPTQLTIKKEILTDLLSREDNSDLKEAAHITHPLVPSSVDFHYRQRIRLTTNRDGELGFRKYRSHQLVGIDSCLLAEKALNSSLSSLRKNKWAEHLLGISTEVELLFNPASGATDCIFHSRRKPRATDSKGAVQLSTEIPAIERVFIAGSDFSLQGPFHRAGFAPGRTLCHRYESLENPALNFALSWEAGGFCQVNLAQNGRMITTVVNLCAPLDCYSVLDLYCGMGNFSIPLAMQAKQVLGVEGQGSAIRSARLNADAAALNNIRFVKEPVHTACKRLIASKQRFDCVVIDPPRQGVPQLAAQLALLTRKKLVYISCDPATLCRDLSALLENGFSISAIHPFDMFPQTHHIETVVLLQKLA